MDPFLMIIVIGGALVVLLLIIGVIITIRGERGLVEERLGRYLEDEEEQSVSILEQKKSSPVGDWLNKFLEGSNWGERQSRELARADLKLKPAEYLALMVIVGFGVGAVTWFIADKGSSIPIFSVIGFVVGLFLPRLYVRRLQGQRLQRFNDQLADMLNLMVNGLRAGYSIMQALEAISSEMPEPISVEFQRVVQEMQLGITMQAALDNLLRRIPSDDLDLVITAMNVQREVGGNLAEILDTISFTIRERVRIKGEIRVLTTQVMYSGRFLAMMPLLIFVVLWLLNRDYMMQFFIPETRLFGIIALVIGGTMIAAGTFVMTRIAKIEV
jgi:tight adherence protein B